RQPPSCSAHSPLASRPLAQHTAVSPDSPSVDAASDNNVDYSPCSDTTVARSDGFSLGFAFAGEASFVFNTTQQLSPCDSRLRLSSSNSLFALFRPKVDEISLLTVNSTTSPLAQSFIVLLNTSQRVWFWYFKL
ncbi:hypothetical protein CMV_023447, partial [Castanea mollissima]